MCSLPAVEDLRVCLAHTGRQRGLVDAFRGQLRQRLLLPGAATTDILQHYIATIKVTPAAYRLCHVLLRWQDEAGLQK